MKTKNIELVKESWATVLTLDKVAVGNLFYSRLFEIIPEVKPMFERSSIDEQSKKLLSMLSYVIAKLDRLEEVMDEVTKLAQRHNKYGVKNEHYNAVGSALLWTLEKGFDAKWNDDLESAWTEIYATLARAMMAAQKKELIGEPVY